jgi:hypothetical protein
MSTETAKDQIVIGEDDLVHLQMVMKPPEIAAYLRRFPHEKRAGALSDAALVGVFCLERVANFRDLDFVRQLLEQQARAVAAELEKLPGKVESALTKQLGSKKGKVLAPVVTTVTSAERVVKEKLSDVQKLLNGQIDPRRRDGALGKAIAEIQTMLDPKHDDSIQRVLEEAVEDIASDDGALVVAVQKTLNAELKPMQEEVSRLRGEIRSQEAAAEALAGTPVKGVDFEDEVRATVQCWGRMIGAAVDQVGPDRKPGDVLVTMGAGDVRKICDGFINGIREDRAAG